MPISASDLQHQMLDHEMAVVAVQDYRHIEFGTLTKQIQESGIERFFVFVDLAAVDEHIVF